MECKWIELGISPAQSPACRRCNTPGSYTPPIIIYVPAYQPNVIEEDESDFNAAIAESFEEERDPEPKPASEHTLDRMRQIASLLKDETCSICLETIEARTPAIVTPCCGKVAHVECMEKTLVVTPCCPYCRWSAE